MKLARYASSAGSLGWAGLRQATQRRRGQASRLLEAMEGCLGWPWQLGCAYPNPLPAQAGCSRAGLCAAATWRAGAVARSDAPSPTTCAACHPSPLAACGPAGRRGRSAAAPAFRSRGGGACPPCGFPEASKGCRGGGIGCWTGRRGGIQVCTMVPGQSTRSRPPA